jgi:hypothetical protein
LVLAFLAGMLAIHAWLLWNSRDNLRAGHQDFTIFYTAGRILSEGNASRLYDSNLQYQVQKSATIAGLRQVPIPYNHPPFEAAIFVPFSKLPFFQAYALWDLLNLLALAGTLLVLRRYSSTARVENIAVLLLTGLAFFPVFTALFQGQDVLLLLLLFALAYSALKNRSDFAAGCWLGLGLFRFQIVLPFVLILVLRKAWRAVGGFAMVGTLAALASIAIVGWRQAIQYPAYVLRVEKMALGPVAPKNMPNLRGLVYTIFPFVDYRLLACIVVILSFVLLWFAGSLWAKNTQLAPLGLHFSLAIIAALLVSYHSYEYDLSLLLIPICLIAGIYQNEWCTGASWPVTWPIFVFFLTPLHILLGFRWGILSLLAVVLLFWFVAVANQCSRPANSRDASLQPVQ